MSGWQWKFFPNRGTPWNPIKDWREITGFVEEYRKEGLEVREVSDGEDNLREALVE